MLWLNDMTLENGIVDGYVTWLIKKTRIIQSLKD